MSQTVSHTDLSALDETSAGVFAADLAAVLPVPQSNIARWAPLELLVGCDRQKQIVLTEIAAHGQGRTANNVLLWGARGTGKSALAKACFVRAASSAPRLKILELPAEDIASARVLLRAIANCPWRVVLFLDDLGVDTDRASERGLRTLLDGGLLGRPDNVMLIATSNRRNLVPRNPQENNSDDLHWRDTREDRLALADRFGLTLGFHPLTEVQYLEAVDRYIQHYGVSFDAGTLRSRALEWASDRGSRSGRTVAQFISALRLAADLAPDHSDPPT
jgi:uncharacterized protein